MPTEPKKKPTSSSEEFGKNIKEKRPDRSEESSESEENTLDIQDSLKNILFTIVWREKLRGTPIELESEDLVSNLVDLISGIQSRTELADLINTIQKIFVDEEPEFDEAKYK